jgi:hypothetical protein
VKAKARKGGRAGGMTVDRAGSERQKARMSPKVFVLGLVVGIVLTFLYVAYRTPEIQYEAAMRQAELCRKDADRRAQVYADVCKNVLTACGCPRSKGYPWE